MLCKPHADRDFSLAPGMSSQYGSRALEAGRNVAQPGSALDWGSRGRGFESRHSDHLSPSPKRKSRKFTRQRQTKRVQIRERLSLPSISNVSAYGRHGGHFSRMKNAAPVYGTAWSCRSRGRLINKASSTAGAGRYRAGRCCHRPCRNGSARSTSSRGCCCRHSGAVPVRNEARPVRRR
jgi:hypothetical protein